MCSINSILRGLTSLLSRCSAIESLQDFLHPDTQIVFAEYTTRTKRSCHLFGSSYKCIGESRRSVHLSFSVACRKLFFRFD